MSESIIKRLSSDVAEILEQRLERLRQQLREAEVQAPPPIFQMLEELRLLISEDSDKARERVAAVLKDLGASEEEFLDWLELDIQLLERKLFKALSLAADPSQVDLALWRKAELQEQD